MRRNHRLSVCLGTGLLLLASLVFAASNLKAENLTITLNAGEHQIIKRDNGEQMIKMEDFGNLLVPGKPMLPAKAFMIALPPGAEVSSVTAKSTGPIEVQGTYRIMPTPLVLPCDSRQALLEECLREWQKNYDITYSSDQVYPKDFGRYLGTGGLRKYTFVRVAYYPFSYYPQSGRLVFNPSLTISIDYHLSTAGSQETERLLSDTKGDRRASELFINYPQAKEWYQPKKTLKSPKETYDYMVITTDALTDAVSPLVAWKEMIGYTVNVVTTSWIESNYSGSDLQQEIRNFLIDKYIDWGIEYVLLAGDIDVIPMRDCYPDSSNHGSGGCTGRAPSDHYYADLTGDWDSDGDGYYGESGQDNFDIVPEVYVGRIPWNSAATVSSICQKLVNFEADTAGWKNRALLLGAIMQYEGENHIGYPFGDWANLMEKMIIDMLSGWTYTTMYEKEGLCPSPYSCDYPLTNDNVVNNWSTGQYGIVNWGAHGSWVGSYRKIWSWDDGDGVPETHDPIEIDWECFIHIGDVSSLDDDYSSVIFANSCSNGVPEQNSIAKELLRNGSAGIVAATATTWNSTGWADETYSGCSTVDYYFFDYLINSNEKVGDALYDAKVLYLNNFGDHSMSLKLIYEFCLYGDPAMVREGIPVAASCITMPITETEADIPFVLGSDTLAILNFVSEELDSVTIGGFKFTLPPNIPEGSNWVYRYYSITSFPEDSSFEATLTLFYDQSEFDASGLSDELELGLCRHEASESTWVFKGGIVDTGENSVSLSVVTEFSLWAITDSSNVDVVLPRYISTLAVTSKTDTSVTLSWIAPGDDDTVGTASSYDIRYSPMEVGTDTSAWWDTAYTVANEPPPSPAGQEDSCTVTGLTTGETYYFAIKAADEVPNWSGISNIMGPVIVGVEERDISDLPIVFSLSQNFPNPFNPITQINYALPKDSYARLEVYNILGQKVATLVDGEQKAGYKTANWNASSLSSGIYFYRLHAGDFVQTRKMVVLK